MKKIVLLSSLLLVLFSQFMFGQYTCGTYEKDCPQLTCKPQTPTVDYGNYKCQVECYFNANYRIDYWEVNGQKYNVTSGKYTFNATKEGYYTICTFYWCNGYLYKCCQQVYCPPVSYCEDYIDHCEYLEADCKSEGYGKYVIYPKYKGKYPITYWEVNGKRYNDTNPSPILETTSYGSVKVCAYYVCNNRAYRCCKEIECKEQTPHYPSNDLGHCHKEIFENYHEQKKVAEQSDKWRTWVEGAEGSEQDAYIYSTQSGKKLLHVVNENTTGSGYHDVIYKTGNKTSGNYSLTMNMWVASNSTAYFNIQENANSLQSGGHYKVIFEADGIAKIFGVSKEPWWTFNYKQGEWLKVTMRFDVDNKNIQFLCEQGGKLLRNTKFTYTDKSKVPVGGINFYAYKDAKFWVDDIHFGCDDTIVYASNSRSKTGSKEVSRGRTLTRDKDKTPYEPKKQKTPIPTFNKLEGPKF